ncbi:hypothetical protein ABFX02_06G074000 [Erythranthe guttata]
MGSNEGCRSKFQMPLHYPRYTRKEYQDMPEWMVDQLLSDYGLPLVGDLVQKRHFAMGAFLWPDTTKATPHCYDSALYKKTL